MVTGLELYFWWGIKPMKRLFLVNKTAHSCWWPWMTPTFALKAVHIEHGLESKRGWQFYTILQRKLIKLLMLKYLRVLPHLKKQGSSISSAGNWKVSLWNDLTQNFKIFITFFTHPVSARETTPFRFDWPHPHSAN